MSDSNVELPRLTRPPSAKGGKPTRTTFSLSEKGSEALAWLAERRDPATQREVFKSIADFIAFCDDQDDPRTGEESFLGKFLPPHFSLPALTSTGKKTRRTFVVDRDDLQQMSDAAKRYGLQRDELIEHMLVFHWLSEKGERVKWYQRQQRVIALWKEIVCPAAERFEREAAKVMQDILKDDEYDPVMAYYLDEVSEIHFRADKIPDMNGEPILESIA